jgi:predicted ATPase
VGREGYVGEDVHLAARITAAGHGGQVLVSQATRALVDEELADLGEHRVKDFSEPVWIFQLGEERFPPLKTISNTNLPRPASSFVGRERKVSDVVALVRDGARLVTLTGPGGTGKTRLGIQAAAELVPEFKAGVFWVGLATLRDPALVVETVAQTLGAKGELAAHVGDREMLVLLDNLEQVIEAAPELAELAEACPNLVLLVTSRERMRVRGEVEYQVHPLAEPDAVVLFGARAQVESSVAVVELCRRLDNMPLALELAAARASVLTVEQIVERLSQRLDLFTGGRDADPRQQTLRTTIEWSHDLLSEDERWLFARLAVFAGGCTLDAAEEVVNADIAMLQALVDKSLVRRTGERLWMLETIREYALERLDESPGKEAVERRHTDFFLALAREGGDRRARSRSDRLVGSPRAGSGQHPEGNRPRRPARRPRRGARAGGALEELLARPRAPARREASNRVRASVCLDSPRRSSSASNGCACLLHVFPRRRPGCGARAHPEGARVVLEAGDVAGAGRMTLVLGIEVATAGDLEEAQRLFEEARVLARKVGDLRYASFALTNLASLAGMRDDLAQAMRLAEEGLAVGRESGDPTIVRGSSILLGWLLSATGQVREARGLALEVLQDTVATGFHWVTAGALELLAVTEAMTGAVERAAVVAGLADRLREETGEPRQVEDERSYRPMIEKMETALGKEPFGRLRAHGATLTLAEALNLVSVDAPAP